MTTSRTARGTKDAAAASMWERVNRTDQHVAEVRAVVDTQGTLLSKLVVTVDEIKTAVTQFGAAKGPGWLAIIAAGAGALTIIGGISVAIGFGVSALYEGRLALAEDRAAQAERREDARRDAEAQELRWRRRASEVETRDRLDALERRFQWAPSVALGD